MWWCSCFLSLPHVIVWERCRCRSRRHVAGRSADSGGDGSEGRGWRRRYERRDECMEWDVSEMVAGVRRRRRRGLRAAASSLLLVSCIVRRLSSSDDDGSSSSDRRLQALALPLRPLPAFGKTHTLSCQFVLAFACVCLSACMSMHAGERAVLVPGQRKWMCGCESMSCTRRRRRRRSLDSRLRVYLSVQRLFLSFISKD